MKRSIIALLVAVVLLVGVVFIAAPDAKAATEHADGAACHCACNGVKPSGHTCDEDVVWKPISSQAALATAAGDGGHYYLTQNVSYTTQVITIAKDFTLCLNGFNLNINTTSAVTIAMTISGTEDNPVNVNFTDCKGTGLVHSYNRASGTKIQAIFRVTDYGTLNFFGGTYSCERPAASYVVDTLASTLTGAGRPTVNLYAGTLSHPADSASTRQGAVVRVYANGVFNVHGGAIDGTLNCTNNTTTSALYGGAVWVAGEMNVYGGTITGTANNTGADTRGGAIYADSGSTLNISGGTISGSTVTANGLGKDIYVASGATVTLSGAPTVGDIYLPEGVTLTANNMTGGEVGVTMADIAASFATANGDFTSYFKSNTDGYVASYASGTLTFVEGGNEPEPEPEPTGHTHCICGGNCAAATTANGHTCSNVTFIEITNWADLAAAVNALEAGQTGNYYLAGEMATSVSTDTFTIKDGVTVNLCFNGNEVSGARGIAYVGGVFNLCDCDGKGGLQNSGSASSQRIGISVRAGGELNVFGGNFKKAGGSAIITVVTNTDVAGAAAAADSTLRIYGGSFTSTASSTSTKFAGGMLSLTGTADASVHFEMYGGTINGGEAAQTTGGGGNIYLLYGSLNIKGGTITGGKTARYGGNIFVQHTTEFLIENATITGGEAAGNFGGNVYINSPNCNPVIKNSTISGGTAVQYGGNIYLNDANNCLTIEGGEIYGGSAANCGGVSGKQGETIKLVGAIKWTDANGKHNTNGDLGVRLNEGVNTLFDLTGYTVNDNAKFTVSTNATTADGKIFFTTADATYAGEVVLAGKFEIGNEGGRCYILVKPGMMTVDGNDFYSVEDAIAAMQENSLVVLNANVDFEALNVTIYLDLNGKTCTIAAVGDSVTVYGIDSTSNDYSNPDGKLTAPEGAVEAYITTTGTIRRYLAVKGQDGTYSFHRFYLGITYKGVNITAKGIGVKATFAATPTVQAMMKSGDTHNFGIIIDDVGDEETLVLGTAANVPDMTGGTFGANGVYTASFILTDAYAGANVDVPAYFRAYISFSNGVNVESNGIVEINPKTIIESIDAAWEATEGDYFTTPTQKTRLIEMIEGIDGLKDKLGDLPHMFPTTTAQALASIPVAKKKFGFNI